jgi:predicted Ser/Thr protein kinase
MASREWGLKKRAVKERSSGMCERCGDNASSAIHHLSYEHLGHEPLEELLDVCKPCHEWLGGFSDDDPAKNDWRSELHRVITESWRNREVGELMVYYRSEELRQFIEEWGDDERYSSKECHDGFEIGFERALSLVREMLR